MASSKSFSDNEMNYYQFKAKQIILQKKEEKEWQDFCKQVAPDCAACLAERTDIKESKDVGIQTFPKKSILRTDRTPLQPKYKGDEIPETLINMKIRLEKIDLALSKLFDESHENEKVSQKYELSGKKPFIQGISHVRNSTTLPSPQAVKTHEEHRKLQIQNHLRANLQNFASVIHRKSPAIKPKNSSFFLPHELEVKRTAARKAYLASLQTRPKVSFHNKRLNSNEITKSSQIKKSVPTKKKNLSKKESQKSKENTEEAIIKAFIAEDTKDENIERVVDAIFEDLIGETALDLNRIRKMKEEKYCTIENEMSDKVKNLFVSRKSSVSSSTKYDRPKPAEENDSSIMKLKSFIDSFELIHKKNDLKKKQFELEDKRTNTSDFGDSKALHIARKAGAFHFQSEKEVPETAPKFVCDVKSIIKIDPERAKDIAFKRDRFWKYLESISRTPRGNFNPWILNESLAESILDDCINDIAEELSEMPSSIIQDLYNQEFIQQVEI